MTAFPHLAGRALDRRRPAWPALARLTDDHGERTVSIRDVSAAGLSLFADGRRAGDALGIVLLARDGSSINEPLPATVVYVDRGATGNVMGIEFADPGRAAAALRHLAA
ncbi:MAG: hypothetical protein QOE98_2532 [Gaiellaceae bacterium]|nr:hypothetical protein [Gaiellaceae bacterium]